MEQMQSFWAGGQVWAFPSIKCIVTTHVSLKGAALQNAYSFAYVVVCGCRCRVFVEVEFNLTRHLRPWWLASGMRPPDQCGHTCTKSKRKSLV
jgi:hypothetical protein